MDIEIKVVFTIFFTFICVASLFARNGDSKAQHMAWRGGVNDPIRLLIMNKNGEFRKFFKASVVVFFSLFITAIWFLL
jgi:hypothetical protein